MIQQIWLVHPEEAMCAAFRKRFTDLAGVRVIQGRFEDLGPHDCFVTAGNAFGLMTAGIDAAVVRYFGEDLMQPRPEPHPRPVLRRAACRHGLCPTHGTLGCTVPGPRADHAGAGQH